MFLKYLVLFGCIAATLTQDYHSYYVPEQHGQIVSDQYDDGDTYGNQKFREYDQGGHKQIQHIRDAHGIRDYKQGENQALRDIAQQAHHNQGAHAAVHASGGQESHVKKAHDKGFYEREKKYGYEKAYGYERETKHHDKGETGHSQGSGYHHNEKKGHYNQGGHAIKDLAAHGNKYNHGSEAHGDKNILIDLGDEYNRGKGIESSYNNQPRLKRLRLIRPEPLRPVFLKNGYISDLDGSLERFRRLSGIHGLGGLRTYGSDYGYNPLRYGYAPVSNTQGNYQMVYFKGPFHEYGTSN